MLEGVSADGRISQTVWYPVPYRKAGHRKSPPNFVTYHDLLSSVYIVQRLARVGAKCMLKFVTVTWCLFAWCQLRPREKEAFNYAEKLKEKYGHHPEVRRIARHRHVPKAIHSAQKELRVIRTSQKKKYVNCLLSAHCVVVLNIW